MRRGSLEDTFAVDAPLVRTCAYGKAELRWEDRVRNERVGELINEVFTFGTETTLRPSLVLKHHT